MLIHSKGQDLTQGVVWRRLLQFAFPIFLGTLFQSLYNTADAVIVGRFAGKEALAAIEAVHGLNRIPVNLFTGLAAGATILISQHYGAQRWKELSEASHNAMFFALLGGLLMAAVGCALSPMAVHWVQIPQEIQDRAWWYLLICYIGIAPSMLYTTGGGMLRAEGDSKTPFYVLIAANIANVLLDLLFVAGFGWGVVGAGLATLLSQLLSAVLICFVLIRCQLYCRIRLRELRFYRRHLRDMCRLGVPMALQSVLYPLSNTIVQSSINSLGVNSIAAWAVSGKLDFLIWAVSDAFGAATSTFTAQNYGAKELRRTRLGVKAALYMGVFSISLLSLGLYFGSPWLAQILVQDGEVIRLTAEIMRFIAPFYVLSVFTEILPSALRGRGESFAPMLITLLCTCLTRVIWIFFIVPLQPSLLRVLSVYPVSWTLAGSVFVLYYWRRDRGELSKAPKS